MTALARALRLVAITDSSRDMRRELVERVAAAVRGGATSVQVRMKDATARELTDVAREIVACVKVPVLSERPLRRCASRWRRRRAPRCRRCKAGGCTTARAARVHHWCIRRMRCGGADSRAAPTTPDVGPVFGTGSKSDAGAAIGLAEFARLAKAVGLPAVGIGGIDAANAGAVMRAGAAGVAAISSIFGSDDSELAAKALFAPPESDVGSLTCPVRAGYAVAASVCERARAASL